MKITHIRLDNRFPYPGISIVRHTGSDRDGKVPLAHGPIIGIAVYAQHHVFDLVPKRLLVRGRRIADERQKEEG